MAWYWPGYSPLIEDASASILQPGPSGLASVCRRRTSSARYVGASLLTMKRMVCPGRTLKRSLYPTIFIDFSAPLGPYNAPAIKTEDSLRWSLARKNSGTQKVCQFHGHRPTL